MQKLGSTVCEECWPGEGRGSLRHLLGKSSGSGQVELL